MSILLRTCLLFLVGFLAACQGGSKEPDSTGKVTALVGASLIDGTGTAPLSDAVLIVRNGRVEAVGPSSSTPIPIGATIVDVSGKTITPGLIVSHGHVGGAVGLKTGPEVNTAENIENELRLYARYGVTSVASLGGDTAAAAAVAAAQDQVGLNRARLFFGGATIDVTTSEEALALVEENAELGVDFIKLRVDDFLATRRKMPPEVSAAAIKASHEKDLKVTAHMFYLEDAKALLQAGADFLAHSVRDKEVDEELITLLKDKDVCLSPTLVREVVMFVYENEPEFFSDPFFLKAADPSVLEQLKDPERQKALQESAAAQSYKKALQIAMNNLKKLSDAGVRIAFGTDSGPAGRFQGYFEHMEMEYMRDAGLSPEQILISATGEAASCLCLPEVGTLEKGKWADFLVLGSDPLADISHLRDIESVWIGGSQIVDEE